MRPPVLLGDEDATVCALILLGVEEDPGGVSSSYCASAVLSVRTTLLLLGDRAASGLAMRRSLPKSFGRRNDPSLDER
jgi:hypothetical protein